MVIWLSTRGIGPQQGLRVSKGKARLCNSTACNRRHRQHIQVLWAVCNRAWFYKQEEWLYLSLIP